MKNETKHMISGYVLVAFIAVLIFILLNPLWIRSAIASNGEYKCTAFSSITTMPIWISKSWPGTWVAGLGGSGAVVTCNNFVSEDDLDVSSQPNPLNVACDMIVFSALAGGSADSDMAHNGQELYIQIGVPEDFFVTECYMTYSDF